MSDIHLDKASPAKAIRLYAKLAGTDYDCALLTGDISNATRIVGDLEWLAKACGNRPLYFLAGNHDYYGSSLDAVDEALARLCDRVPNLVMLGHGEVIPLCPGIALLGHRGWNCGRPDSAYGKRIQSPDQQHIEDFKGLGVVQFFEKIRDLGEESARYFRQVLPGALQKYRTVVVASHCPPFREGAIFNGRVCGHDWQPHFTNQAAGQVIGGIAKRFKHRRVVVYCGHTHSPVRVSISDNVELHVGGAQPGSPALQSVIRLG